MYDTFDNTYQATIGIDFLSKVRFPCPRPLKAQMMDAIGIEKMANLGL
jgi:Ras-related protein Rab-6A